MKEFDSKGEKKLIASLKRAVSSVDTNSLSEMGRVVDPWLENLKPDEIKHIGARLSFREQEFWKRHPGRPNPYTGLAFYINRPAGGA